MIIIKADKIIRETTKAVLVHLESKGQLTITGEEESQSLELWLPKSKINADYKRIETIHCPQWVYDGAVDFAMKKAGK